MKNTADIVLLRDFTIQDIEDEIRWMTEQTEWIKSDTPWEDIEPIDIQELRSELQDIADNSLDGFVQNRKEIMVNGHHIGFVSLYPMTLDEYDDILPIDDKDKEKTAVGIEICEPSFWNQGYGTKALNMWLEYCFKQGIKEVFLETWSGNFGMIKCAGNCGFNRVGIIKNNHMVDGRTVDNILFLLKAKQVDEN